MSDAIDRLLMDRTLDGHGAIQVESAEESGIEPLMIMVGGPIKFWWQDGNWGSPLHEHYIAARLLVRDVLIRAGYCTYFPNEAIKGSWTQRAQLINDAAIRASDVFVRLDLPGVPAEGTDAEEDLANQTGIPVVHVNVSAETLSVEIDRMLELLDKQS